MRVYQTLQAVLEDGTPLPFGSGEAKEHPFGPETDDYFEVMRSVLSCLELSKDAKYTKTLDITIKF